MCNTHTQHTPPIRGHGRGMEGGKGWQGETHEEEKRISRERRREECTQTRAKKERAWSSKHMVGGAGEVHVVFT
jgi:hypothetical protein